MLEHDKFGMLLLISDNLNEYFEQLEECIEAIIWLIYHLPKFSRSQLWPNPNKSCAGLKLLLDFSQPLEFQDHRSKHLVSVCALCTALGFTMHRNSHMR